MGGAHRFFRGAIAIAALAVMSAGSHGQVRISQVYGGAGCGAPACSLYQNDFVELHNAGPVVVDISTWSVQYAPAAGVFGAATRANLTGTIAPGAYYLLRLGGNTNGQLPLPAPDASNLTFSLSSTGGKVALASTQVVLSGCADGAIADLVGYGTANCAEGAAAAAFGTNSNALFRADNGCADTNSNLADFSAAQAAPRNSASAPVVCPATGACCNAGGCTVRDLAACVGSGGAYQGDNFPCVPNVCPPPPPAGACCISGDCDARTQAACTMDAGGMYLGDGFPCMPNPCPPLVGACCNAGACAAFTRVGCATMGADYLGDGSTCLPNACPPKGACCDDGTGACSVATRNSCEPGSTYQGDAVGCAPGLCGVSGTCCGPTGSCAATTALACASPNVWSAGGACGATPCLPVGTACPCDFNGAGGLSVQDIFDFLAAYFGGAAGADFNNSGAASVQDIFDFLACYFSACMLDNRAPDPPLLLYTVAPSPSSDASPEVVGIAEAGSTVRIYGVAGCGGAALATGTAAALASPGLTVNVAPGSANVFYATATDAAGNVSACTASGIAYTHDPVPPSITPLPGADAAAAESQIPDLAFADLNPADWVAGAGPPVSSRDLSVTFAGTATVAQVNAQLRIIQASLTGGDPSCGLARLTLIGPSNLSRLEGARRQLLASGAFAYAEPLVQSSEELLPPFNRDAGLWTWEWPSDLATGNWGLKTIRSPQAWNLRTRSIRLAATIEAGIVEDDDVPETGHEDLTPRVNAEAGVNTRDHATMIAGIIGAAWDNRVGVEGVFPRFITMRAVQGTVLDQAVAKTIALLRTNPAVRVVNISQGYSKDFRMVNPETTAWSDKGVETWAERMTREGDQALRAFRTWEAGAGGRSTYLVICSAGNTRRLAGTANPYLARHNSEFANLAVRGLAGAGAGADHFLAVEATDAGGNLGVWNAGENRGSGARGSVSAPGTCVRSSEWNNGSNYDSAACAWTDAANQRYATNTGTSFATPHVVGLAAYLWSLDPDLTYTQVRNILTATGNRRRVPRDPMLAVTGSEEIDAFAAAMDIDTWRGGRAMRRALVDVDDGSELDGNARLDRDDENNDGNTNELYETAVPGGMGPRVLNMDRRRGDGIVDMKDFRAFRDAFVQTSGVMPVNLDGVANHFKKDLNFDGCVGGTPVAAPGHPADVVTPAACANPPTENVDPRYDFNGNGRIDPGGDRVAPAPGSLAPFRADPDVTCNGLGMPSGCVRDIDVLADAALWTVDVERVVVTGGDGNEFCAPEQGWRPTRSLLADRDGDGSIDYLLSADFHFLLGPSNVYDEAVVYVRSFRGTAPNGVLVWDRCRRVGISGKRKLIVTVPLYYTIAPGGYVDVFVTISDVNQPPQPVINLPWLGLTPAYGEDRVFVWP